ncbi:hypothetical protein PVK06_034281 [Gossypium arboreum]|uniref:Uncharacterized protein n=1 Tax=Gossypium arboreum TaxID=29729 RepID=A0ABR0NFU7_GOSAR|nr:hypothetical protein PVK06_034281 [Gossypium arboreum]
MLPLYVQTHTVFVLIRTAVKCGDNSGRNLEILMQRHRYQNMTKLRINRPPFLLCRVTLAGDRRQLASPEDFPFFPPLDKLQFSRLLFRTFRCGHSARWRTVIVSPSWVGHVDADDVAPYQSWLIADALSMALDEKPSMYPTCSTMETAILVALPQTLAPPRR